MTFDIPDDAIRSAILSVVVEPLRHSGDSALMAAIKHAVHDRQDALNTLIGGIIDELYASESWRAQLKAALSEEIQTAARAKVGSTIKAMPRIDVLPLLKGVAL